MCLKNRTIWRCDTSLLQSCHDCAGETCMAKRLRKDEKSSTLRVMLTEIVLLFLRGLSYVSRSL